MSISIVKGAISVVRRVFIQDSSSSSGAGLTGLAFNTAGLTCYQMRDDDGDAGATAVALVTATRGAWTSKGFKEKDATNAPGWYEFGIPNAALVAGSRSVEFHFKGAANMAPCALQIPLSGADDQAAFPANFAALKISAGGAVKAHGGV